MVMQRREQIQEDPKVKPYTDGASQTMAIGQDEGPMPPQEELDPKTAQDIKNLASMQMRILHGPNSKGKVIEMLKSGDDPFAIVPHAFNSVNNMAIDMLEKSGIEVSPNAQFGASMYLISDLLQLGYAAAGWEELDETEEQNVYEDSLQIIIEKGLKDGSIDPIQLQFEAEKFLDKDQTMAGTELAKASGVPPEPSQQTIMDQNANSAVTQERGRVNQQATMDRKVAQNKQVQELEQLKRQPKKQQGALGGIMPQLGGN